MNPTVKQDTCQPFVLMVSDWLLLWYNMLHWPRLYQTSISPDNVRTSMIVWPRKSSDSLVNVDRIRDLKSSSSSLCTRITQCKICDHLRLVSSLAEISSPRSHTRYWTEQSCEIYSSYLVLSPRLITLISIIKSNQVAFCSTDSALMSEYQVTEEHSEVHIVSLNS